MYRLYQMQDSGNCYKVRLAFAQLGVAYQLIDVDILNGESRTPEFLKKNPNGRVPLLELPNGRYLPESNAAMYYLAEGSHLLPSDRYDRAQVLQWMFFEQYSHEPYIAVARFWRKFVEDGEMQKKDRFPEWIERGYQALGVMEHHLGTHDFIAGGRYSIADISLFAYTHVAHEGGFDLEPFGAVKNWLERVVNQPNHIPMTWRPA